MRAYFLLRDLDRQLGVTTRLAHLLNETITDSLVRCRYDVQKMLRQRLFSLVTGFKDHNDHAHLRDDLAMQTAVNQVTHQPSTSTLYRFEADADRQAIHDLH